MSFTTERELPTLESVDDRMIALMRLILALSALLIIYIDPFEPDRFVTLTYGALVVYSLYSVVLYFLSVRQERALPNRIAHWLDVGCYLILVALSSGTNSIFFFFFFFAILVASFRWGFAAGFKVTLVSALFFTGIGFMTMHSDPDFELNRFLLRPIYLLVLGYMIAYWGGREIKLKRRLRLLKEITGLSNPRFGLGHTVGSILKRLQAFYGARNCLLVLLDARRDETRLYQLEENLPAESVRGETIRDNLARLLLSLPGDVAVVHDAGFRHGWFRASSQYTLDPSRKKDCTTEWRKTIKELAASLDMESFISVPLQYRGKASGRLYLAARHGTFDSSDVDLLMQVGEQIMPVIHNIRLLARLSSNAAEFERQRLARDIHDSVIQPYIGLQYKLAAIRNKVAAGENVANEIEHLFQVTQNEVGSLRGFVQGLKDSSNGEGNFLPAVRRFAAQFAENYDLEVRVKSRTEIRVNDRLASELIQIVHEGLSNIRKHTEASTSIITFERTISALQLWIENDGARLEEDSPEQQLFVPRSITERAEMLGGHVQVERDRDAMTIVKVEIPL